MATKILKFFMVSMFAFMTGAVGSPSYADEVEVETVVLTGEIAPGADPGATFTAFNDTGINEFGAVSFRGFLATTGYEDCDEGLWVGSPGNLGLVACEDYQAAGTEDGTTYLAPGGGFPGQSVMNDAEEMTFSSRLWADGISIFEDEGIWIGTSDNVQLLAREGDQAPGTPEGTQFIGITTPLVLNNLGQVAFDAQLVGPNIEPSNDKGIWLGGVPPDLHLIARKGDPAPDTVDGVVFRDLFFDYSRAITDSGEIVFRAQLEGPGIDYTNDTGIWFGRPTNLRLAVRAGDPVPNLPAGSNFESFRIPILTAEGEIVFRSTVTGYVNTWWLWKGMPGEFELVVRQGDQAPGTEPGVVFSHILGDVLVNPDGHLAFKASLLGPGLNSLNGMGIWAGPPGALELVVRGGDSVPGALPDQFIYGFAHSTLYLNANGDVLFDGSLTGLEAPSGIWLKPRSKELVLIAVTGGEIEVAPGDFRSVSAPGLSPPGTGVGSSNQDGRRSCLSDTGLIAFRAYFDDGSSGIFVASIIDMNPSEMIVELIATVSGLDLDARVEASLVRLLNSALDKLEDERLQNDYKAVQVLSTFIQRVASLNEKKIDSTDAEMLITLATEIIDALGAQ